MIIIKVQKYINPAKKNNRMVILQYDNPCILRYNYGGRFSKKGGKITTLSPSEM